VSPSDPSDTTLRLGPDDGGRFAADGALIGPYRVLREIGRGGQATVYLARDERLDRQVALKVLDAGAASDRTAIERFRREAEITSRLEHSGICPVYEVGQERGAIWIAMRYVQGRTLAHTISANRRETPSGPTTRADQARVLLLFEKAALALHAAHARGVIHRDVKPGNLMVTDDGEPVVLDFGLARDLEGDDSTLTLTGDLVGTPAYMSPEQIGARKFQLDARTDVWSLGVSLYEALTLKRPFDAPTREQLYLAILTKEPPDPQTLNGAIGRDLAVVILTAIDKSRDRRYQTALAFAEDLRRVRSGEPILARPAGPILRLRRWAARNPVLATSLGGLFAVLVVGVTVALVLLAKVIDERNQKVAALGAVTSERNDKQAALEDYDRLGDLTRLQDLVARADDLWPAEPAKVADLRAWVDEASDLEKRLDGHRAVLARLRGGTPAAGATTRAESAPESRKLELASPAAQFKHDTTARLVAELTAFADPDPAKGLLAAMKQRLAFAEMVERRTILDRAADWDAAIASIADAKACPRYRGLRIARQMGLIPLGRDQASGLWEFAHLQTAAAEAPVPPRGASGQLIMTEATGLVLVLIPGGAFRMGAARPEEDTAPTDPNADGDAFENEAPVTQVTLDPFFLSKYEMTQGQWLRVTGQVPSLCSPGTSFGGKVADLRHPVEQVSWDQCELWLGRLGLMLPTEAQWEYAARGGTTTPRWTGLGTDGLARAANLVDQFCRLNGGHASWKYEPWDDGYTMTAPVGSFSPNPFALHDVLGNVSEWCRDWFGAYDLPPDPGDGLRHPTDHRIRVDRGGSWNDGATFGRSAFREGNTPDFRRGIVGVRPARIVR
jgi:formylglycine-generating enzyme required for sulfatase activity/tRNA A-37 threonylcarbamoyl transferase component Bud32